MYSLLIKRVMNLLLNGQSEVLEVLRNQYAYSKIDEIKLTGKGFIVNFKLSSESIPVCNNAKQDFAFGDVDGIIDGTVSAVGFILFVRNGYISTLEGYANIPGSWVKVDNNTSVGYRIERRSLKEIEKSWLIELPK